MVILKRTRSAVGQLGIDGAIGELAANFKSGFPDQIDQRALLKSIHGLDRAGWVFCADVEGACRSTAPLPECLDGIPNSSRVLVSWLRVVAAVFSSPAPSPAKQTELVRFDHCFREVPMMGNMRAIPRVVAMPGGSLTEQIGVTPHYWEAPPMSGPMRSTDESGARIERHQELDSPRSPKNLAHVRGRWWTMKLRF
jgi:hypothetical protein